MPCGCIVFPGYGEYKSLTSQIPGRNCRSDIRRVEQCGRRAGRAQRGPPPFGHHGFTTPLGIQCDPILYGQTVAVVLAGLAGLDPPYDHPRATFDLPRAVRSWSNPILACGSQDTDRPIPIPVCTRRVARTDGMMTRGNPPRDAQAHALPGCSEHSRRSASGHPRRGRYVPNTALAKRILRGDAARRQPCDHDRL